jgi:hypothetical protein
MNKVVKLGGWDDDVRQNEAWLEFIDQVKKDGVRGIVFGETEDGNVFVGCNYDSAKDLVYIYHMLQGMINEIIGGGLHGEE